MEVFNETVRNALIKVIEKLEFKNYDINLSLASKLGDNYGGTLYRVQITGQKQGCESTYNLVCKVPIENFKLNLTLGFEREVHVYERVLTTFQQFQDEKGLTGKNRFTSYVLCHDASSQKGSEYIIMEDLRSQSYIMLDKLSKISRPHVELVVKALAEFHALSFVMQDQKPEIFKQISNIPEVLVGVLSEKAFYDMCDFGLGQAVTALGFYDVELQAKVRGVKERLNEILRKFLDGGGSANCRVINHADCWNNNTMFRYENEKPIEVCLFDWQLSRFCSPVVDLVNYFYNSTEREILEEHFDDLMVIYHKHLTEFIATLGSDPNVLYSYEQFETDLRKYAVFPFVACCSNLLLLLSDPNKPPELNDMADDSEKSIQNVLGFQDHQRHSLYNIRIKDIAKHASKKGFI